MTKKKITAQQRMLASVKRALAETNARRAVARYNGKVGKIEGAEKRARRAENQPTPEQEAKTTFVEADVNDYVGGRRVRIGRAFQRQARFETIEGISFLQLLALRRYRKAFDTSEMSPMKCGLDVGDGGGTGGPDAAISRVARMAFADVEVRRIEAVIPTHLLPTLQAVALYDQDFKAAAVGRYGSSGSRRRERVRRDFLRAAELLAAPPANDTAPLPAPVPAEVADLIPAGAVPAAYLDEQGFMRPMAEIADIIRSTVPSQEALEWAVEQAAALAEAPSPLLEGARHAAFVRHLHGKGDEAA